jgi:hypothetical protein
VTKALRMLLEGERVVAFQGEDGRGYEAFRVGPNIFLRKLHLQGTIPKPSEGGR